MGATYTGRTHGIVGLSDRGRLVLRCMTHHAQDFEHDGLPEGIYWGGWTRLAREALGFVVGDDFGPTTYPTEWKAVQRAIRELTKAGWIEPLDQRWKGRKAYRMVLF
jgi:hypothetical protein